MSFLHALITDSANSLDIFLSFSNYDIDHVNPVNAFISSVDASQVRRCISRPSRIGIVISLFTVSYRQNFFHKISTGFNADCFTLFFQLWHGVVSSCFLSNGSSSAWCFLVLTDSLIRARGLRWSRNLLFVAAHLRRIHYSSFHIELLPS